MVSRLVHGIYSRVVHAIEMIANKKLQEGGMTWSFLVFQTYEIEKYLVRRLFSCF